MVLLSNIMQKVTYLHYQGLFIATSNYKVSKVGSCYFIRLFEFLFIMQNFIGYV